MNDDVKNFAHEICMIDSLKILTKEGFTHLCHSFGTITNISINNTQHENQAFVKFKDNASVNQLLQYKIHFPSFIRVELSKQTQRRIVDFNNKKHEDDDNNYDVSDKLEITKNNDEAISLQSAYLGTHISGSRLIEESKQLKLKDDKIKFYNLQNDDLYGKPLNSKWNSNEKFSFELHNHDFYKQFENCTGGEIKIEKKLSPNIFTGWTTYFNDGENVQDKLKNISDDIEHSNLLNLNNLKCGMLVGAFDSAANLYGRGYITLVARNSANVVMSDYGKVINTFKIRSLPEKYTQLPAYSFKVYEYIKENCVSQLKGSTYVFKVHEVCADRIDLIITNENKDIKIQLKKWFPTVEEYGVPYNNYKNGGLIKVLKIKNMNSLYIRSNEKHHIDYYSSFWNSLAVYCYKNSQPLNRKPYYGEIIGFQSTHGNKNYVRGRIHKYLGDNIYYVKQMDHPIKENVKLSDMIKLPFKYKNMPVNMLKVGLKDSLPYPIQLVAKKCTDIMLNIPIVVNFDESNLDGWKSVDLNIPLVKENLNFILFSLVEPLYFKDIPTYPEDESINFCSFYNLLTNELKEKSVVNMTFTMYHDGIFYLRDKLFGKSFSLLSDMIKEYCSLNFHPYCPHNEEVCLGKYPDGLWYRVMCDRVKSGKLVQVYSVDLGTVAFLNTRVIRKLPIELTFHPIHVYKCFLDYSNINIEKLKLLEKYENTDFEFTIIKNLDDRNNYLINCPSLENILQ